MKPYRTGLIVGKFCPLHLGHQYLIESAQKSCMRLVIISYTKPGYSRCEVGKRRAWLEQLYPETIRLVVDDEWLSEQSLETEFNTVPYNDADEDTHRRFTAWLCHTVLGETVDAIFTSEDYGDGFAEVVSKYQSSPVKHICVDEAREAVPISGTVIRQNPFKYRDFLPDNVLASFVKRAVFLGGESTGKSTLAQMAAGRLKTQFAAEYGREIWDEKNGKLAFEDMLHIAKTQLEREKAKALSSEGWLFCDTSPLTTAFYSWSMFGKVDPRLRGLSKTEYDATFLCYPDFEFVQDGTRQGVSFRERQHLWYIDAFRELKIDYVILRGSLEDRMKVVLETLGL